MDKRGADARKEVKMNIVANLMLWGESTLSNLAKAVNTSRVTVSALVDELITSEIVCKLGERRYSLREKMNFLILKVFDGHALIVAYCTDGDVRRKTIQFVDSMTQDGNIMHAASTVERYSEHIDLGGAALVYCKDMPSCALPHIFGAVCERDHTIAVTLDLRTEFRGKTVLYVDVCEESTILCRAGEKICGGRIRRNNMENELFPVLDVIVPDILVFDVSSITDTEEFNTTDSLKSFCRDNNIALHIVNKDSLAPDEYSAVLAIVEKML